MSNLVAENLLKIRKNCQLSRKAIASLSGFKERTVASYERGENKPSENYINFVSLYFNVQKSYIMGLENVDKSFWEVLINPIKRIVLMYQDIYNYDDVKMKELVYMYDSIVDNKYSIEEYAIEIFWLCEILNIKPSCFALTFRIFDKSTTENEVALIEEDGKKVSPLDKEDIKLEVEDINKYIDSVNIKFNFLEKNGLDLNKDYYAEMIKSRNLAKDNYIPIQKSQKLEEKYQKIIDLLPYASDKFLEDIHRKLKTMKDIQTL